MTLSQHPVAAAHSPNVTIQHTFRLLFSCACLLEACYLLLIVCSLLPGLHLSRTPLLADWLHASLFTGLEHVAVQHAWLPIALLCATFTGLIGIYIAACFGLARAPASAFTRRWLSLLLGSTLVFGITLLFQPMLFSDDVFTFMFTGRLLSIYGLNPWVTIPGSIAHDPYLTWVVSGRNTFNIFGPCWLTITAGLSSLSSNPLTSLFIFKGFILGTHLLNSLLVWNILSTIAPERRAPGTLLYAWCPLALIELAGSGHSEGALLSLLLLATLLYTYYSVVKLDRIPRRDHPWWLSSVQPSARSTHDNHQGWSRRGITVQAQHTSGDGQQVQQPGDGAQGKAWRAAFTDMLRSPLLLRLAALLLFGLALSINLIALLVVPLYIWFDLRTERSMARVCLSFCWQIAIVLVPELLFILRFWNGAETFFNLTSAVDMDHFVHAPVGILAGPLHLLYQSLAPHGLSVITNPGLAANVTVRASAFIVFVVLYAHLFSQVRAAPATLSAMRKSPTADQLLVPGLDVLFSCSGTAVFWYMILVSGWFWPWYILWMLWPFVLWRFNTFSSVILVLAGSALFIYAFAGFSHAPLSTYESAIIFSVPLVYFVIVTSRERHAERTVKTHGGRSQTT